MRFERENRFPAGVQVVEEAMVDPAFIEALRLPSLAPLRLLDRTESGDTVVTRVHYEYTGDLDSFARRILAPGDASWVHELSLDRSTHRAEFRILPAAHADRFSCEGTYTLSDDDGATLRTMVGELRVKIPLIGGRAEQKVAPGMLRRLDAEAEFLDEWVSQTHG